MGTNCAHLVADLFLFCYERDFMKDISNDNQADIIKAFKSTSRYLDDLLNMVTPYFEGMVYQIYPPEWQLNNNNNIMSLFYKVNIFSTNTYLTYGPPKWTVCEIRSTEVDRM